MTTTLIDEYERANDPEFTKRVRAALFRLLPDVIGEPIGALTASAHAKRHACAVACLREPAEWVERAALLVAGENAVRAVDLPAMPSDTVISGRLTVLFSDLAGVSVQDT